MTTQTTMTYENTLAATGRAAQGASDAILAYVAAATVTYAAGRLGIGTPSDKPVPAATIKENLREAMGQDYKKSRAYALATMAEKAAMKVFKEARKDWKETFKAESVEGGTAMVRAVFHEWGATSIQALEASLTSAQKVSKAPKVKGAAERFQALVEKMEADGITVEGDDVEAVAEALAAVMPADRMAGLAEALNQAAAGRITDGVEQTMGNNETSAEHRKAS